MIRAMARAGASEGRLHAVWLVGGSDQRSGFQPPSVARVRGWGAGKGSRSRRVKGQIPDGLAGPTCKWREA